MQKILVIDDDRDICNLLSRFLTKKEYEVSTAHNGIEALKLITKENLDLVLCDFRLPDVSGLELLDKIKEINTNLPVIIITAYSDVKVAVNAIKKGAVDYVTKPIYPEEILHTISDALKANKNGVPSTSDANKDVVSKNTTPHVNGNSHSFTAPPTNSNGFVKGNSRLSKKVYKHVKIIAPTDMTVIINGETGTGKEFIAKEIHRLSNRSKGPFVAIDCGALPKDIAGSEFFGHVKGSFTGAIKNKTGSFELANGGTLFLDEIGNLTYDIQVQLLRTLQERTIRKVGGTKDIEVDVRIIVASNENLKEAAKEGKFREDLFHRLNEYNIELAPLRKRKEDIILFAEHFIQLANAALNKNVKGFSDEAEKVIMNYPWYGNLRELRNVIKRAVLLEDEGIVALDCLPDEIIDYKPEADAYQLENPTDLKAAAGIAEREAILNALDECGGNKSKAAKLLNIDRKTLYNKLKSYDINAV